MTISPFQTTSLGIGLVPFLEHNDASRALMGANMQKQAVPLLYKQKTLVGTGLEVVVGQDTGFSLKSYSQGRVCFVSNSLIKIKDNQNQIINYTLKKYSFAYEHTTINQTACVWSDQKIFSGQIVADAPATLNGELSLGSNLLVGYLPWEGYNYEDGIVLSERILQDQSLSSVTICDYYMDIEKSKFGSDILINSLNPFIINKNNFKKFGYSGVIRKGSYINKGEVLIKKYSPIGYFFYNFDRPIKKNLSNHDGHDFFKIYKYAKSSIKENNLIFKLFKIIPLRFYRNKKNDASVFKNIFKEHYKSFFYKKFLNSYIKISLNAFSSSSYEDTSCYLEKGQGRVINIKKLTTLKTKSGQQNFETEKYHLFKNLNNNNKTCISFHFESLIISIAQVRVLEIGDKLSGRHGNKGIISRILPKNDMPYLPDGKPLDIILNPLGVPSRMNIGQLFEASLGFNGYISGKRYNILPFDEIFCKDASQNYINLKQKESSIFLNIKWVFDKKSESKIFLREGRTGELLDNACAIGLSYILKLVHVVQDKIHSRSIEKYSKVSEQPLGGRLNKGGQRFGEMEVWALEAHGVTYTLQELLTIKSDDLQNRKIKLSPIFSKKNQKFQFFFTESFFLTINFLSCLGLNFSLNKIQNSLFSFRCNNNITKNSIFNNIEKQLKVKNFLKTK
jgi:DNA-directed RNA polymerase subunit beta